MLYSLDYFLEMAEFMNEKQYFTATERKEFLKVYRSLFATARPLIGEKEFFFLRQHITEAVLSGSYLRDSNGINRLYHDIATALILSQEVGLDRSTLAAVLTCNLVVENRLSFEAVENLFGTDCVKIIRGLIKANSLYAKQETVQSDNFRNLLLTFAEDVRVIIIMIADRLCLMRMINHHPNNRFRENVAYEASYLYAPLAHRLGLYRIKTELEDLSMKYEHPEEYEVIDKKIEAYEKQFSALFEEFIKPIRKSLSENHYEYTITARTKSVYSVWLKMQRRNISFDEIYDLLAVRIVFKPKADQPEKWQCWNIYSLITDIYSPKPERIRDWVSVPKANGYEALHLTVMGPEGQWFEVQIRSERMDEIAEKGLAAHWKYKNEGESSELDKWLAGIKEILDQPDASALEFLDEFKLNLFAKEIRVFTPKGYMRTLPKGATALDFAYDIHTEIGNTCIGAKVNHKLVPMSHKLTSGDQVEILTSDKQKPQREWLDFVVTAKARTHINATFKKYRKEQIRTGITIFEAVVKKLDLPPTSEPLKKVLTDYNLTNKDDLYVELAKNIITEGDLEKVLKKKAENKFIKYWKLQFLWNGKDGEEKKKNDNDVQLDVNSDFVIAPCCNPIPGDDVVGMNIAGTKVTVHKRSCPEAIRLMASFGDKIVPIKWVSHKLMSFLTVIKMTGIDKPGIVSDITALIAKEGKVNMRMIHFDTRDGIFEGFIHLYVHNTADLNNIVSRISQIQGVESVMRVENEER